VGGVDLKDELSRLIKEAKVRHPEWHHCRDCDKWYGAEDDEYGPCLYKHARGETKFVTHGGHECDESEELRARGLL
jgi:hypothetical protein